MWLYWTGYVVFFVWCANGLLSEVKASERTDRADTGMPLLDFGLTALVLVQVAAYSFFWPLLWPYFLYTRHAERKQAENNRRNRDRVVRGLLNGDFSRLPTRSTQGETNQGETNKNVPAIDKSQASVATKQVLAASAVSPEEFRGQRRSWRSNQENWEWSGGAITDAKRGKLFRASEIYVEEGRFILGEGASVVSVPFEHLDIADGSKVCSTCRAPIFDTAHGHIFVCDHGGIKRSDPRLRLSDLISESGVIPDKWPFHTKVRP